MRYDVLKESFNTFNRAYRYAKKNGVKTISETYEHFFDRESGTIGMKTFVTDVK